VNGVVASSRRALPALCVALLCTAAADAAAQDALRGKRLFLDVGRLSGAGVSCVDCHGGLPGGNFGIDRAANDPRLVENAVATIPQMARLRGRLTAADYADLAAFIGNPAVPSPDLRLVTITSPNGAERVDFAPATPGGAPVTATLNVVNAGQLPLALLGGPRVDGIHAAEFSIAASDCAAGMTLAAQQSCRIDLVFTPASGGLRTAALRLDHDWIGGTAAVALIGTATAPPVPEPPPATLPPIATEQGGGGALGLPALVGLAALLLGARTARRRLPKR